MENPTTIFALNLKVTYRILTVEHIKTLLLFMFNSQGFYANPTEELWEK